MLFHGASLLEELIGIALCSNSIISTVRSSISFGFFFRYDVKILTFVFVVCFFPNKARSETRMCLMLKNYIIYVSDSATERKIVKGSQHSVVFEKKPCRGMTGFSYSQEKTTLILHICEKQNLKSQKGKIWTDICKMKPKVFTRKQTISDRTNIECCKEFSELQPQWDKENFSYVLKFFILLLFSVNEILAPVLKRTNENMIIS